ncbi:MAG: peptidylprolyl isomerase [Chthoniobacterales bacterium]
MTRPFISMLMTTLAFAAVPLSIAQSSQPQAQVVDGIAAVVNGEVITYSQVRQLTMPREQLLRQQFHGADLDKQLKAAREAALKDLIDRQLIVQDFKKQGFNLPEWLVDQRIDEIIRENFGGDRNTFVKTLQAQNVTLGQFKKEETDKIIVQAMRGKNIKRSSITVSPTKVQEYWEKHRAEFMSKEQVKLRMIMIPTHGSDAPQQKTLAEEILGKLAAGSPFDKMAEMYSEDSTREVGGDWGWIERKTLAAPLEKVAFNLPRNKISNIIELGGNYYILKVEDKRGGDAPALAQVRPQIEQKLQQEEMQKQQDLWLATLREKAYIRTF